MTDTTTPDAPPWRYATLDEARAMECNRCGGCCDLTRLKPPVRFGWKLPEDLFAGFNDGEPLILPIEVIAPGVGRTVSWEDGVVHQFVCAASASQPDGTAICRLYDQPRPSACAGFPVFMDDHGEDTRAQMLADRGAIELDTWMMPDCTWYAMLLLPAGSRVLEWRHEDGTLDWDGRTDDQRDVVLALHEAARDERGAPGEEPL